MSIENLEQQVKELMEKRDKLEEQCDTLPQCEKDDGCETCKVFKEIEDLDAKVEEIEDKIKELTGPDEEEE